MPERSNREIPAADIYVLQGDDELSIREAVAELARRCDENGFGELNRARLNAGAVPRAQIELTMNMLPLGASRRMVLLEQALDCARGKDGQNWLTHLLKNLPSTTLAVLWVPDSQRFKSGGMQWDAVGRGHWLHKVLKDSGKQVSWLEFPLPAARQMPAWILHEAEIQGVQFDTGAAAELANLIGVDLFKARQEISKARSYVGKGGRVTREEVRLLCSQTRQEDIFALMDALGGRDARRALGLLCALLADQPAHYVFSMMVRQVRLLLIAKEISAERGEEQEMIAASGTHPFVARKLLEQCRRFEYGELRDMYQWMDDLDEASKTGKASLDVGLEALIARLARVG